ncbi:MAG: sigma-70 family RNA polymerase sigma factor [Planctomycetota bacterium]
MDSPSIPDPADRDSSDPLERATASFARYLEEDDTEALQRAFLLCSPALHRAARYLAKSCDVEDLVQETFVIAISRASTFTPGGDLQRWLLGILRNAARMRHRLRWLRVRGDDSVLAARATRDVEGPAAIADSAEWRARAERHVSELAAPYRNVVAAYLFENETPASIAARLGRSSSTVRTQLERGMRDLRRRLPAPVLVGLAAMLASQRTPTQSPPLRMRSILTVPLAVAAALLLASVLWQQFATAATTLPSPPSRASSTIALATSTTDSQTERTAARPPAASAAANRIRVRLRNRDGQAIAGLPVMLSPDWQAGRPLNRAHVGWQIASTDERGVAEFANLPSVVCELRINDRDVLHRFLHDGQSHDLHFHIELRAWLQLQVADDAGHAIAGATVYASNASGTRAPGYPAATTDAMGTALVRSTSSPFMAWVAAPGFTQHVVFSVESPGTPSNPYRMSSKLLPNQLSARGQVRNMAGEPVPRATIAAWSAERENTPPCYVVADALGRFEVSGIPPGPWFAAAIADGYATACAEQPSLDTSAVLQLGRGGRVHGQFAELRAFDHKSLRVVTRPHTLLLNNPLAASGAAVTESGAFAIQHLAVGVHDIGFFDRSPRPFAVRTVHVSEGGDHHLGVELSSSPVRRVVVQRSDGRPLANVEILVRSTAADLDSRDRRRFRTDEQGRVALPFEAGVPWEFGVFAPGNLGGSHLPSLWIDSTEIVAANVITVPERALRLGAVHGMLQGDVLELAKQHGIELIAHEMLSLRAVAEDGAFHFDGVPAGNHALCIRIRDKAGEHHVRLSSFYLDPGETLQLAPQPSHCGEVRIQLTGEHSATCVIGRLVGPTGITIGSVALRTGHSVARRLPIGTYELIYPGTDASPKRQRFAIGHGNVTRVGIRRPVGIACRIEVQFHDASSPQSALVATLGRIDSPDTVRLVLPPSRKRPSSSIDVNLLPGSYSLTARSQSGTTTGGTLVVDSECRDLATFPFVMR